MAAATMKSLLLLVVLCSSSWAAVHEADVCVFGGTSGGVTAAVQATRMGKTVHFNARLASVKKDGARITQIVMENGDGVSAVELYDLKSDPGETRNLAGTHPDEVARLMERVESARADLGDYDRVGAGQRFFDDGPKRRDINAWKEPAKKAAKKE
jgi:hypothetical protein